MDSRTILAVEGSLPGVINADPMAGDDVSLAGVDKDWYEVTLKAGHSYNFGASAEVSNSDTLDAVAIRLYDTSGAAVTGPNESAHPSLDYTPTSDGTYYLAVSAGDGASSQTDTGNFEVWLKDNGVPQVVAADPFDDGRLWSVMADCALAAYDDGDAARAKLIGSPAAWETINLTPSSGQYATDGLYTKLNTSAFVARAGTTAVISFGGTDQVRDGLEDVGGMLPSVINLVPLIDAFDQFIANNGITTVCVTGHSLGGALAQAYMLTHPNAGGVSYEAVTFAAPGFNFGDPLQWPTFKLSMELSAPDSMMAQMPWTAIGIADHRVLHFEITGDVVPDLLLKIGDTIHLDCQGAGINPFSLHKMGLYSSAVNLLDDAVAEGQFQDPNNQHVLINTTGNAALTDFDPLFPTEYLVGGAGDDTLGGTGVNKHYGGAGNDTYTVDQTGDVVIELNRTGGDAGGWDTVIAKCDYTLRETAPCQRYGSCIFRRAVLRHRQQPGQLDRRQRRRQRALRPRG